LFWKAFDGSPGFHPAGFLQLYRDTDEVTVMKIMARFHETLCKSLDQSRAAVLANDAKPIWAASHKVSGSAELLGFREYGVKSRELSIQLRANPEISSHRKEIDEFLDLTDHLKDKIAKSCPNLANFLF
jgi:HPt (histidine-containing phosphotransfer) domain-containing protein